MKREVNVFETMLFHIFYFLKFVEFVPCFENRPSHRFFSKLDNAIWAEASRLHARFNSPNGLDRPLVLGQIDQSGLVLITLIYKNIIMYIAINIYLKSINIE
ncbi:hypothetical protein AAZX31_09G082500 [Glycine max]